MEEILSVSGGVLRGSPASPLLSSEKGLAPACPQECFPWAWRERSAEGSRAKELFLGCLIQKKGQSAQQEQREG